MLAYYFYRRNCPFCFEVEKRVVRPLSQREDLKFSWIDAEINNGGKVERWRSFCMSNYGKLLTPLVMLPTESSEPDKYFFLPSNLSTEEGCERMREDIVKAVESKRRRPDWAESTDARYETLSKGEPLVREWLR